MNFTRILGKNDKIYKKFGDYCIAEAENECYIVCCCCQEEHQSEELFWHHIREMQNCALPESVLQMLRQEEHVPKQTHKPPAAKRIKVEIMPDSPMYTESEFYEQLQADPDVLSDYTTLMVKDEEASSITTEAATQSRKSSKLQKLENEIKARTFDHKNIDIARIASKSLLNGKVLKKLFVQMQRANTEFRYKLNRLTQEVSALERELHDENSTRKKYMKIIPDSPLETRDEVLILDGELQRSKEMRNNLHDEALMVITQSPDVYCRLLWRFIMTDDVSNQFCWRGVIDGDQVTKYPIKDMMMLEIFQTAFREKFPSLPLNTFKEKTISYFNKANERLKRNKSKFDDSTNDEVNFDEANS